MTEEESVSVQTNAELLDLTTEIVSAYVSNNTLAPSDVAKFVTEIHETISTLSGSNIGNPKVELKPAVSIKKSIAPDYLICLEDGKKFKSLKRHIRTHYDLSPEEYREKWGLPSDYPMVAPRYSEVRSNLAKANGLGRKAK